MAWSSSLAFTDHVLVALPRHGASAYVVVRCSHDTAMVSVLHTAKYTSRARFLELSLSLRGCRIVSSLENQVLGTVEDVWPTTVQSDLVNPAFVYPVFAIIRS